MSYALPEFLAHAVPLEQETADRYLELADMMEAHRNEVVALGWSLQHHGKQLPGLL